MECFYRIDVVKRSHETDLTVETGKSIGKTILLQIQRVEANVLMHLSI